jgi:hypothetical protein
MPLSIQPDPAESVAMLERNVRLCIIGRRVSKWKCMVNCECMVYLFTNESRCVVEERKRGGRRETQRLFGLRICTCWGKWIGWTLPSGSHGLTSDDSSLVET